MRTREEKKLMGRRWLSCVLHDEGRHHNVGKVILVTMLARCGGWNVAAVSWLSMVMWLSIVAGFDGGCLGWRMCSVGLEV